MDLFELGVKIDTTQISKAEKAIASLIAKMKGVDLNIGGTSSGGDSSASIERKTKAVERYAKMTNTVAGALQYQKQAIDAINASVKSATNVDGLYDIAVTNVKTKTEAAINAINRKSEAFKQEQIAQKQAIAEANKYNAVMEKSQILASKTNLRVSFKEYAEKIALEKQAIAEANKAERAEASLERKRNSLASTTASLEGVTFRYNQRMKEINEIFPESIRDTDRYRAAVANADAEYQNSINRINAYSKVQEMAGTKTRLARHEMLNLSYQLQDIVVGFASGQRPMTVFIQQGAQIAGIAGAAGLGLKGMAAAMWDLVKGAGVAFLRFLSNPYVLAFVAAITALTIAYKAFTTALGDTTAFNSYINSMGLSETQMQSFTTELEKSGGAGITFKDIMSTLFDDIDFSQAKKEIADFGMWLVNEALLTYAGYQAVGKAITTYTNQKGVNFLASLFGKKNEIKDAGALATDAMNKEYANILASFEKFKTDVQQTALNRTNSVLSPFVSENFKSVTAKNLSEEEKYTKQYKDSLVAISAYAKVYGLDMNMVHDLEIQAYKKYSDNMQKLHEKNNRAIEAANNKAISLENERLSAQQTLSDTNAFATWGLSSNSAEKQVAQYKTSLTKLFNKGLLSKSDVDTAFANLNNYLAVEAPKAAVKSKIAYEQAIDPLYAFNKSLDDQRSSFGYVGQAYENFTAYQQQYNSLLSQGIDLNDSKNKTLKDTIIAETAKIAYEKQVHDTEMSIYAETDGVIEKNIATRDGLKKALMEGILYLRGYTIEVNKLKLAEEQAEAKKAGFSSIFTTVVAPIAAAKQALDEAWNAFAAGKVSIGYVNNAALSLSETMLQSKATSEGWGDVFSSDISPAIKLTDTIQQLDNAIKSLTTDGKDATTTVGMLALLKVKKSSASNQLDFTNAGAGDIYGETQGKIDEVVKSQTEYNNALAAGLINQRQFEAGLRENSNALFNRKASMGKATFTESLSNGMSNFLGDYKNIMGSMSKITTDFLEGFSSGFADAFAGAIVKGDNLKESLQNVSQTILTELVSALIQMGIKYAIGTALGQQMTAAQLLNIQAVSAAQTAATVKGTAESTVAANTVAANAGTVAAASAPAAATTSTWSFGAAAAAGAAGMLALLAIAKMFTGGFKDGGYTGNYGTSDVAGVVHGQEFVVNADATAKNRALLEAMNNGATITGGSSTTATTQATNNMTYNHTSQITINGNPDNTTLALIAQAVEQGAKKGYALVAQDFKNNGNLRKAVVGNK